MDQKREKVRLDEVTLMRAILAILIVFMHSFTCYQGGWPPPEGFVDISLYKWIAQISFAFTLEAFVLISGYLYGYQVITQMRTGGGKDLIISKLKRLITPSVIFSTLYFIVFYPYKGVGEMIYKIINGCGHMWFLPMLFWCFVGGWLLKLLKLKNEWKLILLVLANLFVPPVELPLQITGALRFLVYFYGGFILYQHKNSINRIITKERVIVLWFLFLIVFFSLRPHEVSTDMANNIIDKLLILIGGRTCRLVFAWLGIFAFYCTSLIITRQHTISSTVSLIATCSMGIYLFQQFILKYLYYHTGFSVIVGPYWLPWCGFLIAMAVSLVFSVLMRKTKCGRFLIG